VATDYGKRLKLAMKHAELSQKELIKATGIAQSSVSSAINRGSGSADTPKYALACGVDALWLATGEGEMLQQGSINREAPVNSAHVATKDLADPFYIIRMMYDKMPQANRQRALDAAVVAMLEFMQTAPARPALSDGAPQPSMSSERPGVPTA
jgi:transcriptional regulator with XRE-family HTH domain